MIEIEKYLLEKKEDFRIIRGIKPQFALKRTLCCGELKKDKFYINADTGQWDCKLCGLDGGYNSLRDFFLDEHVKIDGFKVKEEYYEKVEFTEISREEIREKTIRLLSFRPEIIKYIESRGINSETIKEFSLGVDEKERLAIPIFRKGVVIDLISGFVPGQPDDIPKYLHAVGADSLGLINGVILEKKTKPKVVIITEGTFDCLTIWQNVSTNVVGTVGGATNISNSWVEYFRGVELIYVIYDNDNAGRVGVEKLKKLLGKDRTVDITVPDGYNDINEFFCKEKNAKEILLKILDDNKPKRNDSVKHISEFGDELLRKIEEGELKGLNTGLPELDNIISGYKPGQIILLGALTSVGKTTSALNFLLSLAFVDTPTYFTSLEMTPAEIGQKLLQMVEGIGLSEIYEKKDGLIVRVKSGISKLSEKPIYLYDGSGITSYNIVEAGIRSSVKDYGVRVAFIDYLQYFTLAGKNRAAEVGDLVNSIKGLAMELGITIYIITQLNRGGRSKQRTGLYIPSMPDLKESSTLEQSADVVMFLCRDSESVDKREQMKTILKVAKNRGGKTGHLSLNFDGETGIFSVESQADYLVEALGKIETIDGDSIFN